MSKVEKIKAEIERLKNELIQEAEKGYKSEFDEGRISAFEDMITFIDTLETKGVSDMSKILKQENSTAQISCPRCRSIIRYCNSDLIPDSSCNSYNIFMNAGIRNGKLRCPMCGVEFFTSYIDEKGS